MGVGALGYDWRSVGGVLVLLILQLFLILYVLVVGGVIHIACQYYLRERASVSVAGVIYYILLVLSVSAPAIWVIWFIHFVGF